MKTLKLFCITVSLLICSTSFAQLGGWNPELVAESNEALEKMIERTPKLQNFVDKSSGYAIIPKVTKAAIGVGGAGGKGIVYHNGVITGEVSLSQATIGLQLGGQQYSEVVFFEDEEAYDHFINGKLKFDAQASAVAITAGASVDVAYVNGVAVFTMVKGGLMYEASIGGQKFKFRPEKD